MYIQMVSIGLANTTLCKKREFGIRRGTKKGETDNLISFHQNYYRNFKHFYQNHVCKYWRKEFPKLLIYNRFVEFMGSAMMPLCIYLKQCFGGCTGIIICGLCLLSPTQKAFTPYGGGFTSFSLSRTHVS